MAKKPNPPSKGVHPKPQLRYDGALPDGQVGDWHHAIAFLAMGIIAVFVIIGAFN